MATEEKIASGVDWLFSCGQQMQKYGYRRTAAGTLCQKAHEECGSSWKGELPKETNCHIQSAGGLGTMGDGHRRTQCVHLFYFMMFAGLP